MRLIGMDIHRVFAKAVALDAGKPTRRGRVDMRRAFLPAVAEVIGLPVKRVVIANLKPVRIMVHAKIKTDTIDAGVLAQLHASGFLPEVWIADQCTQALRRRVTRRNQIVRQRSRVKKSSRRSGPRT